MPWDGAELCVSDLDTPPGPALHHPEVVRAGPTTVPAATVTVSRSPRPGGRPTGRCGSWPTAPAGGTSTAGPRRRGRARVTGELEVGGRRGCSASRRSPSSTTAGSPTPTPAAGRPPGGPRHGRHHLRPGSALHHGLVAPGGGRRDRVRGRDASRPSPPSSRVQLAPGAAAGEPEVLRPPRDLGVDPAWFSVPEAIDFPTTGGAPPTRSTTRRPTPRRHRRRRRRRRCWC